MVFGVVLALPLNYLDHLVMAAGIVCGSTRYLLGRWRNP